MRYYAMLALAIVGIIVLQVGSRMTDSAPATDLDRPAPEFPTIEPDDWFNSPPLGMSELRGRVVLLEIWTFG